MNGPSPLPAATSNFPTPTLAGKSRGRLLQAAVLALLCLILSAFAAPASAAPTATGSPTPTVHTATTQRSDSFQLHFHNYYNQTVSVAIMYRDYTGTCNSYGGWATKGWWNIEPGGDRYVLNTTNRHVYFYAHTPNNQIQWTGTDHHMYTNRYAFNSCRDIGTSTWNYVGLRHINMGSTYTTYTYPLYVNQ